MDDEVDPAHGLDHAGLIPHVADEVPHLRRVEGLLHLELLQLIPREDDHALGLVAAQDGLDVLLAERPRSAGDED
ncbi:hypothetical protein D3C72_2125860 [compost metagenome]